LAGIGFQLWTRLPSDKVPMVAAKPSPVPVETLLISPQPAELTRIGLGTVQSWDTATITPQVSGEVIEMPFREGGTVGKGDVLVRIDPRPFQAALDQAKAREAQDQANLVATQKNLLRDQTLLTKGGYATQQTVDNEQAQVDALKAAIAGDIATIETAQLNLEYATIKAPFPSIVGLRNIDVGNVVSPVTNIVTLTQIEPIAVDFTLPQVDLAAVKAALDRGSPAVTALDQDGSTPLAYGVLQVLNNQVDPTTGTIKLKARFDNRDHKLWPGAFVQARVILQVEPNAIVIPSRAVQRGPEGF
jgi:membrane fusion protein, multidrug efflux system